LQKAQISQQGHFAEVAERQHIELEQEKQTLRSMLVHLATGIFLQPPSLSVEEARESQNIAVYCQLPAQDTEMQLLVLFKI
jgi:hypothetical protein